MVVSMMFKWIASCLSKLAALRTWSLIIANSVDQTHNGTTLTLSDRFLVYTETTVKLSVLKNPQHDQPRRREQRLVAGKTQALFAAS